MSDLYDPLSVSDSQAETEYTKQLAQQWLVNTEQGRRFNRYYNTEENRTKLQHVFEVLDEPLTLDSLSAAFERLVQSGAIQTEAERRAAQDELERQRDEANRIKWQNDCEAWIDSRSTREIAERSKTDRAFASWLRQRNIPPVVETDYDPVQLAHQKNELRAQREKDRPYLNVPEDLRNFAESYRRMSFAEVQRRQRDPQFRKQVDAAAHAGLI